MGKIIILLAATAAIFFFYWVSIRAWKALRQKFPEKLDKTYPVSGMQLCAITPEYKFEDFIEKFNFAGAKILPASGYYNITYTNRHGITTNRNISVSRVYENNGKFVIDAYCHLRANRRSFFEHRINRAVDLNTGQFVNNVAQHAITSFDDALIQKTWETMSYEMMGLYLLEFICCVDRRMLKTERSIVADYLKRRRPDIVLDDEQLERILKRLGTPDPRQFKRIVSDMKASGDIARLREIADCAKRLVAPPKTADPLEKAAIEILEEACARIAPLDAANPHNASSPACLRKISITHSGFRPHISQKKTYVPRVKNSLAKAR
jgi:hypothetical protein